MNIPDRRNNSVEFLPELKELVDFYREIDSLTDTFKEASGLKCVPFCKACCSSPRAEIEASVFECLPLSIYLWQIGEAEFLIQELERKDSSHPCILCDTDEHAPASWGCEFYEWRPLVCRLFGFSAVLDKHGRTKIALCRPIKEAHPGAEERINRMIQEGLRVPIIPHLAQAASSLSPSLGRKRYPFHLALKLSLEMIGLRLRFVPMDKKKRSE